MIESHGERKHSIFSASGSERWFNCTGSVSLSKGTKSKETPASQAGTLAHEVLEDVLSHAIQNGYAATTFLRIAKPNQTEDMREYAQEATKFIWKQWKKTPGAEIWVETRIHLKFVHPEMFGTFDSAIIDHFGTLHIFDYKYGVYTVSPEENLQLIFYALGVAHKFHWNFKRVRTWIIQPRARGYDGPAFWEIGILELKKYVGQFRAAVKAVEQYPDKYKEGSWCFFCPAKGKCPLKTNKRLEGAKAAFSKIGE